VADRRIDLLQGTLDLLILKTLAPGPMHGWGLAQRIEERSGRVFLVNQGSLYPALHRLEREGLIQAEWGASDNNRRARFYDITREGRRQLEQETATWERAAAAITRILSWGEG
jgi:PadR family transcriptional regulator, regulatory protein PadR